MFHVKHDGMGSAAAAWGVAIPEDRAGSLLEFETLLTDRGIGLGLVAGSDRDRIRERHILDSLRAAAVVTPGDGVAVDIGSGGGLPGIVIAIVCPDLRVVLAERRRNRVAFLELAVEHLHLGNVQVAPGPVEALDLTADLAFARAFSDLRISWKAATGVLAPGGRLVYFAGAGSGDPVPPEGVRMEILAPPPVASAGPLVIMSQQ